MFRRRRYSAHWPRRITRRLGLHSYAVGIAGNQIHFPVQCRHPERMNHIFGFQIDIHRRASRYVNLVSGDEVLVNRAI